MKGHDQELLEARQKMAVSVIDHLNDHYGVPRWCNPLPPLDELVSTILSQNTNDRNRDTAFNNLNNLFPSWELVRDASPDCIVAAIRSAGLANQKGSRIQQVLKSITEERGNLSLDFLRDLDTEEARNWLMGFKGVGPKTAAIVLCFSLGKPAFPVDTHIQRVSGRLELRDPKMSAEQTHRYLESIFPVESYYSVHLNLIRLGREICHPHKPECPSCPLNRICPTYLENGII
jgi:endonuclease-3